MLASGGNCDPALYGQFGNEFNLKNAAPIYIRNKVAQTTKERLSQK